MHRPFTLRPITFAALALLAGHAAAAEITPKVTSVRLATFNVSMYRDRAGQLAADLADPSTRQARLVAEVLQTIRPDIVLLNEFDWDAAGESLRLLRQNFLEVGQAGLSPINYRYYYVAESNTGVHSGHDLDGDGKVTSWPGSRAYGGDAFGFGQFPGQYGFAILSRYPIVQDRVRTFRQLLWKDLPGALIPADWYAPAARDVLRLSSKNHVDVPVQIGERVVHVLASHPTPPTFDGPEDRNGRRNHDEVRFWSLYIDGDETTDWLIDDQGRHGGLGAELVRRAGRPEFRSDRRGFSPRGDPRTARSPPDPVPPGAHEPRRGGTVETPGRTQHHPARRSGPGHRGLR